MHVSTFKWLAKKFDRRVWWSQDSLADVKGQSDSWSQKRTYDVVSQVFGVPYESRRNHMILFYKIYGCPKSAVQDGKTNGWDLLVLPTAEEIAGKVSAYYPVFATTWGE